MSLTYALIGCGRVSPNHINAALKNGLEIIALCDTSLAKVEDACNTFASSNVKQYTDYRKMLENEELDLVAIATESGTHAKIALDVIERGCNVIIEKPIALSIADANLIIARGKAKGVKVSACHQNRFNKAIQQIRQAIEQERFGKLLHGAAHIRWSRGLAYYQQDVWRGTWEQDGGALMNQCIHNIDLLRWMMGNEIVEVMAMTDRLNHDYIEAEDLGLALVKFANGSYGLIEGTVNVFPDNLEETLYVFGEKGTVKAGGLSINQIDEWVFADQADNLQAIKLIADENPSDVYGFGHSRLYGDMIDAINNNRDPYVTAEDGKRALELVLAIYQSAAKGCAIRLPLEDCSTLDFKGRFS